MAETVRWLSGEEQHAWRSFVRLHEQLGGRLGRLLLTESNVSGADFAVLVNLADVPSGKLRAHELAKTLGWEKSRMSHAIARMVRRGLVAREESPDDGRGAYVVITDAGRVTIEATAPLHVEAVRRLFLDHVTSAELHILAQVSERVVEKLAQDAHAHRADAARPAIALKPGKLVP